MPALSLSRLLAALDPLPSSAAIFLHGDEAYSRDCAAKEVVERFLDPATRDFNYDQISGSDATPDGLASLIATPPMMAEHRVILLRDAQGLSPKGREVIERAAENPSPGSALIVMATIPGSSKAKFYKNLIKRCLSVDFPALNDLDLPGWVVERASDTHGVEMDIDAARALSGAIGSQLGILSIELEKAVAFVGDRKRITLADIEAVGGYIPRVDRWRWFDKIGEKRFSEAIADLPSLLDSGESGVGLVIGMTGQLLKIGLLVAGGKDGLDRAIPPNQRWLARRLQPQSRHWTLPQIDRALADLLRSDRLLKSASLSDAQAIEELLLRLSQHAMAGSGNGNERRLQSGATASVR